MDGADFSRERELLDALERMDEAIRRGGSSHDAAPSTVVDQRLVRAEQVLRALHAMPAKGHTKSPRPESLPVARIGKYVLERAIASGGFAVVYRARDPLLGRDVAIKVPHAHRLQEPESRLRFLREAQATSRLDHPHIVPTYEAGLDGETPYIAYAYCAGPTLADWLAVRGLLEPRRAAELGRVLADAVQHSHDRGIWHRDIKPSNVLLFPMDFGAEAEFPFVPRLADFGLARVLEAEGPRLTASEATLGTPRYMAPEQIGARRGRIGPATDVYGLGALLYEAITGRPPFEGQNSWEILTKIAESPPAAPRLLRPQIPRDLETICLTCLAKEPGDRYATAGELEADLERFLEGRPIRAVPSPWWKVAGHWALRHRVMSVLLVSTVALVMGLLASLLVSRAQQLAHQQEIEAKNQALEEGVTELRAAVTRADQLHQQATAAAQEAREFGYVSDLQLAESRWKLKNLYEVRRLLDRYAADPQLQPLREFAWWYLHGQISAANELLAHDRQSYWFAALTPDQRRLAVCGNKSLVQIVDLASMQIEQEFSTNQIEAGGLDFSPDGRLLAVAGDDGTVQFWRLEDRHLERTERIYPLGTAAYQVRFRRDGKSVIVTGDTPDVVTLDLETGNRSTWSVPGAAHGISCMFLSPDGRQLSLAVRWNRLLVVDSETFAVLHDETFEDGKLRAALYSLDGQWLGVTCEPNRLWLYDPRDFRRRFLARTTGDPLVPGFSRDGRLICGTVTGAIDEWALKDVLAGGPEGVPPRMSWQAHDWVVQLLLFHPARRTVISAGREGDLRHWTVTPSPPWREVAGPIEWDGDGCWYPLAASRDSRHVWRTTMNGVEEWDVVAERRTQAIELGRPILFVAPQGDSLFVSAADGHIGRIPLNDPASATWWPTGRPDQVCYQLEVTPDRSRAVLWFRKGGSLQGYDILNLATGVSSSHAQLNLGGALTPDGQELVLLVGVHEAGDVQILEFPSLKVRRQFHAFRGYSELVRFGPGGRLAVASGSDGKLVVFRTADWSRLCELNGNPIHPSGVAISPDERTLAVCSVRGQVHLWHLPTGRQLLALPPPPDGPLYGKASLTFTADGQHLVLSRGRHVLTAFDAPRTDEGQ